MSRTPPAKLRCALLASAPNIAAVRCCELVVQVSGHGGVPPRPGTTKLPRAFVMPRGQAARTAAFGLRCALLRRRAQPHRCPLLCGCCSGQCVRLRPTQGLMHGLGSLAPRARSVARVVAAVVLARYGHSLRSYITPRCSQWPPVATLTLRLVSSTAARPCGCQQQALCKVPFAGGRSHSRRRSPVACAPYAPPSVRPCASCGTCALVRRYARC